MDEKITYGLIGFPLGHSFSKGYFSRKFLQLNLPNYQYLLFEIPEESGLPQLLHNSQAKGFNVTIPYKEKIIKYLDGLDESAQKVGAVNVVKRRDDGWIGYNSDYIGFKQSLYNFLGGYLPEKALILGTGGASKAVAAALADVGISYQFVSRTPEKGGFSYQSLKHHPNWQNEFQLIVNCSPVGTFPNSNQAPDLDYEKLKAHHFLFDLVYNPPETLFLKKGLEKGAKVKNGLEMLELQAERAWEIWNSK